MSQQKNNQKVVCNMYNLAPILVSNFPLLLLPTGSPLMKLWQFWPFQSPPDHPKCYLTAKSSPQPSIHIFRKSKKKLATFPIDFFRGIAKVWEGGHFTPPPPHQIGLTAMDIGSYLGFVNPEWNWHLFRILRLGNIRPRYIPPSAASIHLFCIQFTSIQLLISAWFSLEHVILSSYWAKQVKQVSQKKTYLEGSHLTFLK